MSRDLDFEVGDVVTLEIHKDGHRRRYLGYDRGGTGIFVKGSITEILPSNCRNYMHIIWIYDSRVQEGFFPNPDAFPGYYTRPGAPRKVNKRLKPFNIEQCSSVPRPLSNNGRSTCYKCGGPTKQLNTGFFNLNLAYCPKCEG